MKVTNATKIRTATITDAPTLAEIGRASFYDAFKDHPKNAPEDMQLYMNSAFGDEIQKRELLDEKVVYLIAEIEDEPAGYLKLNKDVKEETVIGEKCLEIARLYALQKFIGKGVGAALMQAAIDFAEKNGFDTIWLGVWEYNYRAQAFYKKWGFEPVGEHVFQLGNDAQTDWIWQRKV